MGVWLVVSDKPHSREVHTMQDHEMTMTHVEDWVMEIRQDIAHHHVFYWTIGRRDGSELLPLGIRQCGDPRREGWSPRVPFMMVATGDLQPPDANPLHPGKGEIPVGALPIEDPREAWSAALEARREEWEAASRAISEAQRAARGALHAERDAAWRRRRDEDATRLYWRMDSGINGMVPATEPDPPTGIYKGWDAAQKHLIGFLRREYFGVIPGSWGPACVQWEGYRTEADARSRHGDPVQTRDV